MRENLGVDSKIFIYQVVLGLIMKDKVFFKYFWKKFFTVQFFHLRLLIFP
jgi:hypothetical protein